MAKKRKSKKVSRRRRSVSGVGSKMQSTAVAVIGIAAAAFAVAQIEKLAVDSTTHEPLVDPKLMAGALIGAGALVVPKFLPGALGQGLGNGLVAVGTISLLKELKVISGTDTVDFSKMQLVSGTPAPVLISGVE